MKTDFSVAWGNLACPATKDWRPYPTDAFSKHARDKAASDLRKQGKKVRLSSLRSQRREWWGWQQPCGLVCTVYSLEVVEADQAAA